MYRLHLGFDWLGVVIFSGAIGWGLDYLLKTTPWFLLFFIVLGMGSGFYKIYFEVKKDMEKKESLPFELRRCMKEEDLVLIHEIRETVLFQNRNYNRHHADDRMPNNHNFLFFLNGTPIGTVRLDFLNTLEAAVRLVAILPAYQRQGIGSKMLQAIESYAQEHQIRKLVTNARLGAQGFYAIHGYSIESWIDPGEDSSCPTVGMTKNLIPKEEKR